MTNEYGARLDRNGYAPSIVQEYMDECFICRANGYRDKLDRHEIFTGRIETNQNGWGCG